MRCPGRNRTARWRLVVLPLWQTRGSGCTEAKDNQEEVEVFDRKGDQRLPPSVRRQFWCTRWRPSILEGSSAHDAKSCKTSTQNFCDSSLNRFFKKSSLPGTGMIVTNGRNLLNSKRVEEIVFCQQNYRRLPQLRVVFDEKNLIEEQKNRKFWQGKFKNTWYYFVVAWKFIYYSQWRFVWCNRSFDWCILQKQRCKSLKLFAELELETLQRKQREQEQQSNKLAHVLKV